MQDSSTSYKKKIEIVKCLYKLNCANCGAEEVRSIYLAAGISAPAVQVTPGSCDRSFGIHVARIANFPPRVVAEAENLAGALESGEPLQAHFAQGDKRQYTEEDVQQQHKTHASRSSTTRINQPAEGVVDDGAAYSASTGYERGKRKAAAGEVMGEEIVGGPTEKRSR